MLLSLLELDSTNQAFLLEVWLTTMSSTILMPRSAAFVMSSSISSMVPNDGSML